MKKIPLFYLLILFSFNVYSIDKITSRSEVLTKINIGNEKNEVIYQEVGEDIFSLLGISVTRDGMLFIPASFFNSFGKNRIYTYTQNNWSETETIQFDETTSYKPYSQSGYNITSKIEYFKNNSFYNLNIENFCDYERDFSHFCYFVPKGILIEKQHTKIGKRKISALEVMDEKIIRVIEEIDEVNEWLKNQSGNFYINDENQLMKDGNLYSCYTDESVGLYNGKLKSGHNLFISDNIGVDITDSTGSIEIHLDFSWANENRAFSYGVGNYGEIYCIIEPRFDSAGKIIIEDNVQLVVIRNHLKSFGILNDDKIRLRKGPGTNTESLGTYPIKTGFRILEKSGVKQTIGGVTDEWIKVRLLDGTEGYFFGQYVQNLYDGPGTPLPWPNVPDWD